MNEKESKFFKKIFYSYLAFFTVLTLLVVILAANSISANKKQSSAEMAKYFDENYTMAENKLLSVIRVVKSMSANSTVWDYADEAYTGYDDINFYSFLQLKNVFADIIRFLDDFGCSLSMSRVSDNILFDGSVTKRLDEFLKAKDLTADQLLGLFDETGAKQYNAVVCLTGKENGSVISIIYKNVYPSGKAVYFFADLYKEYYLPAESASGGDCFGVVDLNHETVCVNAADTRGVDLAGLFGRDADGYDATESIGNGIYARRSGVVHDLMYVYYNPGVAQKLNLGTLIVILLAVWMVLMIAGVVLSQRIARKIYSPVNNLFTIIGDMPDRDNDDMLFLKESVVGLVRNNEQLHEIAEKNREFLRRSFVKDVLTGSVNRNQIRENLKAYELEYLEGPCFCIACEFENLDSERQAEEYRKIQALKSTFLLMAEDRVKENARCEIAITERSRFALITTEDAARAMQKTLRELIDEAQTRYGLSLVAGIGKMVENIYDLYESYLSALRLLEYRIVLSGRSIISAEDLKSLNRSAYYYPIEVEKLLIVNVLEGNREKCGEILSNIFSVNFGELSLDVQNIRDFNFAIAATVKRILMQINKTPEEVFGTDRIIYLELMELSASLEKSEIESVIRKTIDALAQYVLDNFKGSKNEITASIIAFIDDHYQQDISLNDVAEHFGVSPGHIGRLLKNNMDTSFKQYLNKHRIEVAKELLLSDRNLTVGMVASMVGCNSAMTFIHMFKRYTGVSPGDYKKAQRE